MALRALKRRPEDHAAIVVSTAEDETRLRGLIGAELERRHAKPLARRALALMAEAALEPMAEPPHYRVIDRHGDARYRPAPEEKGRGKAAADSEADEERLVPVSLADLVEELRGRHPDLFSAPPPEPEPEPEPAHHAMQERMAHARAAGARFVESQSARARALAHSSAEGSRALASAAGERFGFLRARLTTERDPAPVAGQLSDVPPAEVERTGAIETVPPPGLLARLRPAGAGWGGRRRPASPDQAEAPVLGRRAAFAGIGALCLAGLVTGAILLIRREPAAPDPAPAQQATAPESSGPAAPPKAAPPAVTPPPGAAQPPAPNAADPELQPSEPEDAPAPSANTLTGVPEVIDTATLRVSGKLVPLFGVEWVRGGQAEELRKYLAGRTVSCQPAPGSSAFLCTVEGRDLSEVVLFNGGGRASPEATPDLVAAEDHARSERLGVWKR